MATLALAALGVVYGDIGTSPLYALRECFNGHGTLAATSDNVLGVLSLIIWSLLGLISVLYLMIVLRADNDGEGGILALMALVSRSIRSDRVWMSGVVVTMGLFGSALLYGDGMITPAISVLSAIEGLEIATPMFAPYVVPITMGILIGLFLVQFKGTSQIGKVFGPITLLWFICLALLGVRGMMIHPGVIEAISPHHAIRFLLSSGWKGFVAMGSVFLVVTGGEALYADMGHFGARPIRLCWFVVVLPALVLNYLGQGALLLTDPKSASNPFYLLVPSGALIPMVILAAAATVIASQAVISGVFSMTRQGILLGYMPRIAVRHTSADEIGQVYLPAANACLLVSTLALVLAFRTSSALAAAYGIAVTSTMLITVVLTYFVMRDAWGWSRALAGSITATFLAVDLLFFGANCLKIVDGGWLPLAIGLALYAVMVTWKDGRELVKSRLGERTMPLENFFAIQQQKPALRVPGTAVYLTANPTGTPPALVQNLRHNKVLHERVLLLTLQFVPYPKVSRSKTVQVIPLQQGFNRVIFTVGFMENPDILARLPLLAKKGISLKLEDITFFLGREILIPSPRPGMALWREHLFAFLSRNSQMAANYFNVPDLNVVELGIQIEI